MKTKPYAATVLTWLKQNGHRLGGLTSTDTRALLASVQIVNCWSFYAEDRDDIAKAWGTIVRQMQPGMQQMAFHAVAHVSEWDFRFVMWKMAGMEGSMPTPCYRCKWEPQERTVAKEVSP